MEFDKKDIIDQLKFEIAILKGGGYHPSVRNPRHQPRVFRDSPLCPNVGLEVKQTPCMHCFLMQFVPPQHWQETEPCHYIPLNEGGDTIAKLGGDPEKATEPLLAWLRSTVERLEKEVEAEATTAPVK
jgi:hypothetical protein